MLSSMTRGDQAPQAVPPDPTSQGAHGDGVHALEAVQAPVDELLTAFLAQRVSDLATLHPALEDVGQEVAGLVGAGSKRLRPAFVYWGYRATGAEHREGILGPAAAVELLHTFALIHDDVMDRSARRRGRPAVHMALAGAHTAEGLHGDPDWFGVGGAILAGDLAFVWADQLLDSSDLSPEAIARARRVFTDLRIEVMAGQYLDLRLAALADAEEDDSLRVALLKSGRYTVTRPLQLGAAIGGGDARLDAALTRFGDAVGMAFQLRDDVLGLFGDPRRTGKGAVEDLREGKRTVLFLRALGMADAVGRKTLVAMLGDPDLDDLDAHRAREIVVDCGALDAVESLIAAEEDRARRALRGAVEGAPREALEELAHFAAFRVD